MTRHRYAPDALPWLSGDLGPPERRALREIVERGDLAHVDGQAYLVTPVSPETLWPHSRPKPRTGKTSRSRTKATTDPQS